MKRTRGRPRQYDEASALQAAAQVFWTHGFSATSLDHLSVAMQMNRPSIYRAFGDKEAIYRRALKQFGEGMELAFTQTMLAEVNIKKALTSFYRTALDTYLSGTQAKGCMVMSTAVSAAVCHPEIQSDLLEVIRRLDKRFEKRFQQACELGELSTTVRSVDRAMIAQGVLHSLSLRARAGEARAKLLRVINTGVALVLA